MRAFFSLRSWPHKKIAQGLSAMYFGGLLLLLLLILVVDHGLLRVTGYGIYHVESDSMTPVLEVSDYVWVKQASLAELSPGDIIVFETKVQRTSVPVTEQVVVIHYFETVDNGSVLTYSEANKNEPETEKYDTWGTASSPYQVTEDDILGIYSRTLNLTAWGLGLFAGGVLLLIYKEMVSDPRKT